MATLTIRFGGELGSLSIDSVSLVLQESLRVLRDLDRRISEQRGLSVKWVVIGLREVSPTIVLDSRVIRGSVDYASRIQESFRTGIATLDRDVMTPPLFSTENVQSLERITKQFEVDGLSSVAYANGDGPPEAVLTPDIRPKLARLTGVAYESFGSIEGLIEVVSLRRRDRRFNITHHRTMKSIRCTFPAELEPSVFEALQHRRRVMATGLIGYNSRQEPVRLKLAKTLRFLRGSEELPGVSDLTGSDPGITGSLSTEDFVRTSRD